MEKEYYTPRELANKLGVSLKSIQTWTQERRIIGQTKMGRHWKYRITEVNKRLLNSEQFLLDK